jgi:hypothetical protein
MGPEPFIATEHDGDLGRVRARAAVSDRERGQRTSLRLSIAIQPEGGPHGRPLSPALLKCHSVLRCQIPFRWR